MNKSSQKPLSVSEVLLRQVAEILPSQRGLAAVLRKQKIRLYLGVDPTSPNLHLGHAVLLRKLKQFQELGHEVVLLFGTFTARIGDPSGRDKQREPLTLEQIKKHMETYKKQAGLILDMSKTGIDHNHKWLSKLTLEQLLEMTSHFTTAQLLERDMFQRRFEKHEEVWMHELLYPLMQGYDSVALDVDLEIGGTDQTFNMLMGRRMQRIYNQKEKYVLTVPLLLGLDGRKMSKSFQNTVNLTDSPEDMFGKIMSVRDELIIHYYELATEASFQKIGTIKEKLKRGTLSYRDAKAQLATEIVSLYHGPEAASKAANEFERIFREKQLPADIPVVRVPKKHVPLVELLLLTNLAPSRSEARRLVEQGGVRINQEVQADLTASISVKDNMIIQVGKRRFVRLTTR